MRERKFALLFLEFILSSSACSRRHGPPELAVPDVAGRQEAPGEAQGRGRVLNKVCVRVGRKVVRY